MILNLLLKFLTNPKINTIILAILIQIIKKKMEDDKTTTIIKSTQPLFLPRGSIRAIITIIMILIMAGSFIWHYIIPAEFLSLSIFAVGYYVGYRTDNTQTPEIK